jgi:hypothetical protein
MTTETPPGTTLEEELLQAAEAEGALGNHGRAHRLRMRAARARDEYGEAKKCRILGICEGCVVARRLAGPLEGS